MPEISLKAYFAKLNNLLGVSSADEVIQHSRHILQSYPKNVTAYRFLGRALVLSGRWDEGREALRRVLSVYPDDYIAHLGLSEANERLGHPDEAIWHLERAYEQNSNNRDVIEALRNLYRRYRNVENLKMQLTSAAVARQNLRSKNYTQAIDTLRSARARMNDRLDLKLLLAQVLWEHGSQEEAAEIAVEVLKVLPDCLEANKIMAQLWLEMGRPSDARRYVNHLEAVDPYLAVEVAQGFPPDDDVFQLDELDYVRTSQSELASARPDWLSEIGSTPMPVIENADEPARDDWSSLLLGNKSPAPPVEPGPLTRFTEITPQPEPKRTGGLTDLFGDPLAPPAEELKSLFERATGSLDEDELPSDESLRLNTTHFEPEPENTGNLTDLFGEALAQHTDDLASLFEKNTGAFGSESGDSDDRMAWMRDAGIEMVEPDQQQPSYRSLMAEDEDSELPVFDDSPMAWLEDHNSDLILESDAAEPGAAGIASNDELPSWMRDAGIGETSTGDVNIEQEDDFAAAYTTPQFDASPAENEDESLDWLQSDNLFDETPSAAEQLADEFPASLEEDFASFSATDTDWQNNMPDQQQSPTAANNVGNDAENAPAAPGARRGLTAILQEGNFDWVKQEKPEEPSLDAEMDDWLNQFGPAQPHTPPTDTPDWLSDLGISESSGSTSSGVTSNEDDEWFKEDEPERLSLAAMANANEFARMSENDDSENEEGDWLSALPPEEEAADTESEADAEVEFEWGGGEAPVAAEADVDTGALPDWLTDYVPADGQADITTAAEMNSAADASAPQPEADTALTDWLSERESEDEPEAAAETPASESEVSWTEETGLEDEEAATEEVDWLSGLQPADSPTGATEAVSGGDTSWLSELGSASSDAADAKAAAAADAQAEPAASEDMDWLSELEPVSSNASEAASQAEPEVAADAQAEPVTSDDMDWLSELEPVSSEMHEAAPQAEVAAEPVAEDMSWLTDLGVDAETLIADVPVEPVASEDADWLSELETVSSNEMEAEPVASEDMDWLSELEPAAPATPEAVTNEASAVNVEDFPWMSSDTSIEEAAEEEQPVAEADTEPAAEADLDWLNELEREAEQPPPVKLEPAASSDLEWLSELDAAPEKPAVNVEDFPWMSDAGVSDARIEEDAEQAAAEQPVVEADAEPAAEADMDWLAELEPASSDEAVTDAEPVAEADADWLTELQPDVDTGVSEQPIPAAAADEDMNWLSELEPTPEPEKEAAEELAAAVTSTVASEEDSWLNDDSDDADEGVAAEMPAAEIPAWLSDLEPDAEPEPEPEAQSESSTDAGEDDWLAAEEEADEEESAIAAEMPAWLTDLEPTSEPEKEAAEEVAASVVETGIAAAALDGADEPEDADEFVEDEETLEPTPAQNAPDWLNAMVPGLDVDFEASEDAAADDLDEESYDVDEREYAWVEEIVEQEMAAVEGSGFTFTRPPAWFASLSASQQNGSKEDDFPDWVGDDSDLPDYLR